MTLTKGKITRQALGFILYFAGILWADSTFVPNMAIGPWSVTMGADNRIRYSNMQSYDFSTSSDPSQAFLLNRVRLKLSADYKESLKILIQGLDAREWAYGASEEGNTDWIDLQQAWIELMDIGKSGIGLKVGRQQLIYGGKRLISAPVWGNKVRSFDAAAVKVSQGAFKADVFGGSLVQYKNKEFNESDFDQILAGVYGTYTFTSELLGDAYYFSQLYKNSDNNRRTAGLRVHYDNYWGWTIDAEYAWQFNANAANTISAFATAFYVQKKLETVLKPRVRLEANLSSGDENREDDVEELFIPPYQTVHGPYGIIDFFRWQNMREVAGILTLQLHTGFSLQPELHWYWLDGKEESWYNSSGKAIWQNDGTVSEKFAGGEASLVFRFVLNKYLKGDMGYSYFHAGDVAGRAGEEDGVHYFYGQTIVGF